MAALCAACLEKQPVHDEAVVPPGFDVESCAEIAAPGSPGAVELAPLRCADCCLDQGLRDSSFILDDACVCANLPPLASDLLSCRDAIAEDECLSCCDDAGYTYSGITDSGCECLGLEDPYSCDDVFGYKDPRAACSTCCLEEGYLGVEFRLDRDRSDCVCTR